jgi:DNA-binding MarR family transcriptional regulator
LLPIRFEENRGGLSGKVPIPLYLAKYIVLRYILFMPILLQSPARQRLQTLADFRYTLRQFLHFSESCAIAAGLHPQQHQLLLHIAGAPEGVETTISYAAERLGLRHHSVVELSKRCEEAGWIHRRHVTPDRRYVVLGLTAEGDRVLEALSEAHERELYELVPKLVGALTSIRGSAARRLAVDEDGTPTKDGQE